MRMSSPRITGGVWQKSLAGSPVLDLGAVNGYDGLMKDSAPSPVSLNLRVNVGWALTVLLRDYQKQVEADLSTLPQGTRAFMVMALVEQETSNSQAQIAERLGLDKTTLTYLLDDLEKAKLIKRTTDPGDRRNRRISLTAKGSQTLAHFAGVILQRERQVLGRLTDDETSQFRSLLFKAAGLPDAEGNYFDSGNC